MPDPSRRDFLKTALAATGGLATSSVAMLSHAHGDVGMEPVAAERRPDMDFGLVTYLWGKDWDVPTLIRNCTAARLLGVELRTGHAHKVEPSLSPSERTEVKKRFADSPVTLVGIGSAEEFHHPDPARLAKAIEATKTYVKLAHDVGASGVKVRPNDLPKGVPQEKTIEQIGKSLNLVGAFAADFGQQIRVEIHGGCSRIPIIKRIIDIADHPNVGLCWNSNTAPDLAAPGLDANFKLLRKRFGRTAHVRALDSKDYPFAELIALFVQTDFRGWILLEGSGTPKDPLAACIAQRRLYDEMVSAARRKAT